MNNFQKHHSWLEKSGSYIALFSVFLFLGLGGCSASMEARSSRDQIIVKEEGSEIPATGSVSYAWEEPMMQVVDVPPRLDPDEVVYIPGHQEVIEVRPGRWQLEE